MPAAARFRIYQRFCFRAAAAFTLPPPRCQHAPRCCRPLPLAAAITLRRCRQLLLRFRRQQLFSRCRRRRCAAIIYAAAAAAMLMLFDDVSPLRCCCRSHASATPELPRQPMLFTLPARRFRYFFAAD